MKYKIIIAMLIVTFMSTGCINVTGTKKTEVKDTSNIDAGVYKSEDYGVTWKQYVGIASSKAEAKTFASVGAYSMAIDPNDSKAIYFGSIDNGLLYTYDGGENWHEVVGLPKKTILDVVIDPLNKCTIYASIANTLYKSTDCSRTWVKKYVDNDTKEEVTAIAIDHYNNSIMFIGDTNGNIIKSVNGGESWKTTARTESETLKIVIDPNDSRIAYVITKNKKIYRTIDNGETWREMKELKTVFSNNDLKSEIKDVVMAKGQPGLIFIATYYGLIRSDDGGNSWKKINLLLDEKDAEVIDLAINEKDVKKIFYVTNNLFYRSNDGGTTWGTPIEIPGTRAGREIVLDLKDEGIVYLGVKKKK